MKYILVIAGIIIGLGVHTTDIPAEEATCVILCAILCLGALLIQCTEEIIKAIKEEKQ